MPLFYGSHYLRNGTSPGRSVWARCNFPRTKNEDILLISVEQSAFFQVLLCRAALGNLFYCLHHSYCLHQEEIPANSKSGIVARSIDTLDLGRFVNSEVNYLDLRNWVEFISNYKKKNQLFSTCNSFCL